MDPLHFNFGAVLPMCSAAAADKPNVVCGHIGSNRITLRTMCGEVSEDKCRICSQHVYIYEYMNVSTYAYLHICIYVQTYYSDINIHICTYVYMRLFV